MTAVTKDLQPDTICEHCGAEYFYDEGRNCWRCDVAGCPRCLEGRDPLCPSCLADAMESVAPMLATSGPRPTRYEGWQAEFKWDGVRALTHWDGSRLRIESRNQNVITARYPELADLGERLGSKPCVLDGEIVAIDPNGRPSFPLLQRRMHARPDKARALMRKVPIVYFVFDLLNDNGVDITEQDYASRRRYLEQRALDHPNVRLSPRSSEVDRMIEAADEHELEGVVLKQLDAPYEPGHRSRAWRKVKRVLGQEFVIGGWKPSSGGEEMVGSLLLGVHDDEGLLRFVGKTGTGFGRADHELLLSRLKPLQRKTNPFADEIKDTDVRFVRPLLVAEVEYRRWPQGKQLHQAAYKGLRQDKPAAEIVREGGR